MVYEVRFDVPALALTSGDLIVHRSNVRGAIVGRSMDETHFRLLLELAPDALKLTRDEPDGAEGPALVCVPGGAR
jgi:hypothetical protein